MVGDTLAAVFRADRNHYNARFAEARQVLPNLDIECFQAFLVETLDPLLEAVREVRPEAAVAVTLAAYEAGLELVGQQLAGPRAKLRHIEQGWRRLLISAVKRVCESPEPMLAATSNALHNLGTTVGAHPELWISELERLTPLCSDVDIWLRVGQVLAWRAGLAHYREGALAVAGELPERLAAAAMSCSADEDWTQVYARLKNDPWFDPGAVEGEGKGESEPGLAVVKRVGGFRGFGGLFSEPPTVSIRDDRLVVWSDQQAWTLLADCYGATFHRLYGVDAVASSLDCGDDIYLDGTSLLHKEIFLELVELGEITSAARTERTLALTGRLTHSIVLVALG